MLFGDIPVVGMLKQRMSWHQQRQEVLAQNVANAETPGYRARDLSNSEFVAELTGTKPSVQLARTSVGHLSFSSEGEPARADLNKSYEITPRGTSVSLEDEVMRVSQNVMDYQMVSSLYTRGLGMIKTALGKQA